MTDPDQPLILPTRPVQEYDVIRDPDGKLWRCLDYPHGWQMVQMAPCEAKYWSLPRWRP